MCNIVKKAGCILINKENNTIALVLRDGDYSFPKGHLENDETIRECAIRETIEETGHEVKITGEEVGIIKYVTPEGENVENHMFIGIDQGPTNKQIADKDKEVTKWFKIDEIGNILSYQNLKNFWNEIKHKILF